MIWHPAAPFGNCWQYALASILDVPADDLPDQITAELHGRLEAYDAALRVYLGRHHGLAVRSIPLRSIAELHARAAELADPYLLFGPTVRTPISSVHHAVVGQGARVLFDPHPSRAGLAGVVRADVLVSGSRAIPGRCACPTCGGRI